MGEEYKFVEFAAVMCIYFVTQAYGYAIGVRSRHQFTIQEAVVFGAKHLMHFLFLTERLRGLLRRLHVVWCSQ
jgi:hypothetical protein